MPILQNAKKALRSSARKQEINNNKRSQMTTALKAAVATGSPETLAKAYSMVDRAAKRNIIHGNAAARLKRQVAKRVKK